MTPSNAYVSGPVFVSPSLMPNKVSSSRRKTLPRASTGAMSGWLPLLPRVPPSRAALDAHPVAQADTGTNAVAHCPKLSVPSRRLFTAAALVDSGGDVDAAARYELQSMSILATISGCRSHPPSSPTANLPHQQCHELPIVLYWTKLTSNHRLCRTPAAT
ncbi:hypothetical protein D9619_004040 [Psilocybe cf. subviscida]|uniref:Uncharacterized protein n=1 Tax=Psilocybe cf. subviscida TaxID=2480587 RepID=A0A8H5F7M5_9AGAR|nr:hypothetical protein D9619_004040 [Psilocybe cf. subviscida]